MLASTGLALGAVSAETFSLAMGAVVISILTAEPLLAGARRLGDALDVASGTDARCRARCHLSCDATP